MKIAIVSARFPPQRCGVGDYTYFLSCALASRGHSVDVITGVGELDLGLNPLPANVRVLRDVTRWDMSSIPSILRILRDLRPDLLMIQYAPHAYDRRGITLAVNLLPTLAKTVLRTEVMTNFHELYNPFDRSLRHGVGALWQRAAAISLAISSDRLSVTTAKWKLRLRRSGIRKPIQVIPVGSSIPFKPLSEQQRVAVRTRVLGSPSGILLAGFGARHDRDIPSVLHGLRRLKALGPARLLWIGGGSPSRGYSEGIESAMKDSGLDRTDVEWTGVLPHPEVSTLLSACDVMVLPFVDGISTRRTSAVTALQHGLPILTTRGPGPERLFIHGQNVYSIPVGDRYALEDGLLDLASKPELRVRLGLGARQLYDSCFAWNVIAEQIDSPGTAEEPEL